MTEVPSNDRAFILQAMVSVAASDGDLHEDELEMISTIYVKITGKEPGSDDINSAQDRHRSQEVTFADQLASEHKQMSKELKEAILSSAYMVLLADGRVAARERKILMDFAKALKISEVHRSIIFEDVERSQK
jgi:tellurite resistance protein